MNAETSAWGRAIVALGITGTKRIASREEVRNRQGGEDDGFSPAGPQVAAGGPTDDGPWYAQLIEAARGFVLTDVKECYIVAGLKPPDLKRDCFKGLDVVQGEALYDALRNKRIQLETDTPYDARDLDPPKLNNGDDGTLPWNLPVGDQLTDQELADRISAEFDGTVEEAPGA